MSFDRFGGYRPNQRPDSPTPGENRPVANDPGADVTPPAAAEKQLRFGPRIATMDTGRKRSWIHIPIA